ncbi:hypothetical protein EVAR_68707_1 [Eumeta japonica]|uniref:Uncharacterized protein n=1 Tax=Eumeta variegata TaxID=151549 RepID=A0A4C1ZZP2_EUMVA|nr:hypothetical protein EVAR_68707_1 [Eumeta japonica]
MRIVPVIPESPARDPCEGFCLTASRTSCFEVDQYEQQCVVRDAVSESVIQPYSPHRCLLAAIDTAASELARQIYDSEAPIRSNQRESSSQRFGGAPIADLINTSTSLTYGRVAAPPPPPPPAPERH